MIVVSDTSPLNYLVLIEAQDVLPKLYPEIVTATAVLDELKAPRASNRVRLWASTPPAWLQVRQPRNPEEFEGLGRGETAALNLAVEIRETGASARVLIDDRAGRAMAEQLNFTTLGTLAVLSAAAVEDLLDLPQAIDRLRRTNFYAAPALLDELLRLDRERQGEA